MRYRIASSTLILVSTFFVAPRLLIAVEDSFQTNIRPILESKCFDCHSGNEKEGNVQFDGQERQLRGDKELWLRVLKNVRSGLMPPHGSEPLSEGDKTTLHQWIQKDVFQNDPTNPIPGKPPLRRLNRREYRNTILDLTGVDFNAEVVFPPDDTGFGFDTVGDAMSVSPMLLEKYIQAAKTVAEEAVPTQSYVMSKQEWKGKEFRSEDGKENGAGIRHDHETVIKNSFTVEHDGEYVVSTLEKLDGSFEFHPGRYRVVCRLDGTELYASDNKWEEDKLVRREFTVRLAPGKHQLELELRQLESDDHGIKAKDLAERFVTYQLVSAAVGGPKDPTLWKHPKGFELFFTRDTAPDDPSSRKTYAAEVLRKFATKAYRRPASDASINKLVAIAESVYSQSGKTFEDGIQKAISAVLASSQFLYRIEPLEESDSSEISGRIDEFSLATRLSYLLWSTMPDEELLDLASKRQLRAQLPSQLQRMVKDERANAFVESFAGQWLRASDVEKVSIDPIAAYGFQTEYKTLRAKYSGKGKRFQPEGTPEDPEVERGIARLQELGKLRDRFDASVRSSMRKETEKSFEYIMRNNRSLIELIDADYVFVDANLAKLYELEGVEGKGLRKVPLPAGSPRGGVLTQGTMLSVTSNPTRTSPVKRGLFLLDNILGTPAPPAPPNVPALEDAADKFGGREPSLRELLAAHRESALCSSCHSRMDPLGLALESFNAVGAWRDLENGAPIETAGELTTGEKFANIQELKRILATDRRKDFYRCVTEKLFIYALGRGLEYYDDPIIEHLVDELDQNGGRFDVLLEGLVHSAAFQRRLKN
jgi:hypothetical protein